MEQNTTQKLQYVRQVLTLAEKYDHAVNVLSYDQETICPPDAMEEQGEVWAFLNNQSYKLVKDPAFIEAAEYLYEHREELEEFDRVMAEQLHRNYLQTKNVTPELQHDRRTTITLSSVARLWASTSPFPASMRTGSGGRRASRTSFIPRPARCSRRPWKAFPKRNSMRR